jgi:hypothetical protein
MPVMRTLVQSLRVGVDLVVTDLHTGESATIRREHIQPEGFDPRPVRVGLRDVGTVRRTKGAGSGAIKVELTLGDRYHVRRTDEPPDTRRLPRRTA